jgi:hypothetical protein
MCDLSGEYTSNKFYEFLALYETIYQILCTDTPKQNGITERKHRHNETAYFLLLSASIPNVFWGEVVFTTIGLIDTILSSYILGFFFNSKSYIGIPLIIPSLEFLVVLVSFFILM